MFHTLKFRLVTFVVFIKNTEQHHVLLERPAQILGGEKLKSKGG